VDNTTNRLMTINTPVVHYDSPGNMTGIDATSTSPATAYVYNGTEMMTGSTVGTDIRQYVYTADDERIAVKRGSSWTWSVRDLNKKVPREFTSVENGANFAMTGRARIKDYVWRDGLLLATTTPNGTLHYHLDHLGTPRLITDANAVRVAEHAYYPFGAEINLTPHETPEEEMKFTGHERDIVAGDGHTLDYMHARYYNATGRRFLQVDPLLGNLSSPQSGNRNAYVSNNPMNHGDPTGKCTDVLTCAVLTSGEVGGVAGGAAVIAAGAAGYAAGRAIGSIEIGGRTIDESVTRGFQGIIEGAVLPAGSFGGTPATVGQNISSFPGAQSSHADRREATRTAGIPTSQQPTKQSSPKGKGNKSAGRQLEYDTPQGKKLVQHPLQDRNHDPHWEAGSPKPGGQTDPAGRPRLQNDKAKVDEKS
jgi:RHS repeat-associated protein